jgi:subtilisin family serine protease
VVANGVQSLGGRVISRYTKAYNGLLVRVPAGQLQTVAQMPGVKAVHKAPRVYPSLSQSVPLIRATQVMEELGLDGTGMTIAIIDSGVDYTHAAFGGPGTVEAYESNDPTVIEEGTFPTAKVIGGYDFAGANYDSDSPDPALNTPVPDPDPLDGDGHGTHVASIAAGLEVPGVIGHGVAPGASIYALKVFGEPAQGTELHINAIEWSLDPNQDNDLSDRVDVINMSLGSDFAPADPLSPDIAAVGYAAQAGVVVVAAAGNAGDVSFITGTPAAADAAISVAASTTGFLTGPTVTIADTGSQLIYGVGQFDDNTGHFTDTVSAPLAYVGNLFEDDLLCEIPAEAEGTTPLAGHVALIQRGTCDFSLKANNAAALGAVAALIYNHEEGGNSIVTMVGVPVTIPTGFIAHDDGLMLIEQDGANVTISAETEVVTLPNPYVPVDTAADFTSRGPRGLDSILKPDVAAPGVAIFAAQMGSGNLGISIGGTSMASPHVAGVAALIRHGHPDWSPEQIKAAIMNTAVDLQPGSAEVPMQGAGRVDAYRAVTTDAFAIGDTNQVSLNWGVVEIGENTYEAARSIILHDFSGEDRVYDVSVEWGENSPTDGVLLTAPETAEVSGPNRFAYVEVNIAIDATQVSQDIQQLEEYYGYVVFTSQSDTADRLRVPFYLIPRPYSRLAVEQENIGRSAQIELSHTGPISSNLWAYPLYEADENDVGQADMADLRMVGMDYGFRDETYGRIFTPAINVYAPWHTPQPYFAEFDLYLDVDQDGSPDFADFNWNAGAAFGTGDDDQWIVVQVDLATFTLSLGSPFLINTDYTSGLMEWALPEEWHGLSRQDSDFAWQLLAFDFDGNLDGSGEHVFDLNHRPYRWGLRSNPNPDDPTATLRVEVRDQQGLRKTDPLGLMLVDFNGKPGEGQAYAILR